jgi:hypothetical protein
MAMTAMLDQATLPGTIPLIQTFSRNQSYWEGHWRHASGAMALQEEILDLSCVLSRAFDPRFRSFY